MIFSSFEEKLKTMKNGQNRIANFFKLGTLLLGFSLLLWNCQEKQTIEELEGEIKKENFSTTKFYS